MAIIISTGEIMIVKQHTLNEEGFFIRELHFSDADEYKALLTHPKVSPVIPMQLIPNSKFDMIKAIASLQSLAPSNRGAYWAICEPGGRLIGTAGYESWVQFHKRLELAFELHPNYQGRGLMTQALTKIIDIGFKDMGAERIEAYTIPSNAASIKLLKRLGFTNDALLKKYRMFNGKISDIQLFSLTK